MTKKHEDEKPITSGELYAIFNGNYLVNNGISQQTNGSTLRSRMAQTVETFKAALERPFVSEHAVTDAVTGLPVNVAAKQPKLNQDGSVEEPTDEKARDEFRKEGEKHADPLQVRSGDVETKTDTKTDKTKVDKFHK